MAPGGLSPRRVVPIQIPIPLIQADSCHHFEFGFSFGFAFSELVIPTGATRFFPPRGFSAAGRAVEESWLNLYLFTNRCKLHPREPVLHSSSRSLPVCEAIMLPLFRAAVIVSLFIAVSGLDVSGVSSPPAFQQQESPMPRHGSGPFDGKVIPLDPAVKTDDNSLGRMSLAPLAPSFPCSLCSLW